jgi:uncharacterized protein YjeT (DUF2065 family)
VSEPPDPLEAELSALRPHEVSPELRRRVAERLADAPPRRLRRLGWLALAGGLAAACLAAVLLGWWARRGEQKPVAVRPRPAPPAAVEGPGPTLLAYERALARSPEDLDALLDRDAGAPEHADSEFSPTAAFNRSDAAVHDLLGDD